MNEFLGKNYSLNEDGFRQKIFLDRQREIIDHNQEFKEGKTSFTMGLYKWADWVGILTKMH